MKNRVAVLIPCYNEELTIKKVINDFKRELPEAEIYVYDNNSTDKSVEFAEEAGAIVRKEYKQGKGNVIRSMFRQIVADCYIMVDADDTYPAEEAKKMSELVLQGKADMVIGDRLSSTYFIENKRPFHNFGNKLVRRIINILFRSKIRDIMTGYRAFSYEFVKSYPILSKGFELETEMTIYAIDANFKIYEMPVQYRDRPKSSVSKLNTYKDGTRVLKTIAMLFKEYKPFAFFSLIAIILLLISLAFGIPVFIEYFETGIVPRYPTLIVSGFTLITAILIFNCGVILDVIAKKHRQTLEVYRNIIEMKKQA